jgi:hypothetical protein
VRNKFPATLQTGTIASARARWPKQDRDFLAGGNEYLDFDAKGCPGGTRMSSPFCGSNANIFRRNHMAWVQVAQGLNTIFKTLFRSLKFDGLFGDIKFPVCEYINSPAAVYPGKARLAAHVMEPLNDGPGFFRRCGTTVNAPRIITGNAQFLEQMVFRVFRDAHAPFRADTAALRVQLAKLPDDFFRTFCSHNQLLLDLSKTHPGVFTHFNCVGCPIEYQ